ncbi:DUF2695 domain-containing protein [Frigoriglobus tundricola]
MRAWCAASGLEFAPVEAWLLDTGGGCDCEALAGAEPAFREACGEPGG